MLDPINNHADLIFNTSCCSWNQLYKMLAQAMEGTSAYQQKDIEAGIYEKVYFPLFQDGTIVRLEFPSDTPGEVRERVVEIHAAVCRRWDCDPSWSRDPKA